MNKPNSCGRLSPLGLLPRIRSGTFWLFFRNGQCENCLIKTVTIGAKIPPFAQPLVTVLNSRKSVWTRV